MRNQLPPIAKAAMRVLAAVYQSVDRFSRSHKYTVGADLRIESMAVARAVTQAWHQRGDRQMLRVREVAVAIDNLKITLQLCDDVKAFRSFAEFESLARIVNDLGRQCGGWLKSLHSMGQSPQGNPPGERAPILSSRTATQVATP